LIKPEWVRRAEMLVEEGDLRKRIKKTQERDEKMVKAVEKLKKTEIKLLKDCHMTENNHLNNITSFIFYIITNFSLLNSCCLLL